MEQTGEYNPNDIVAGDYPLASRSVSLKAGRVYNRGDVLGRNEDGSYSLYGSAEDQSAEPGAICAYWVDASEGDTAGTAYFTGEFANDSLFYGDDANMKTANAAFEAFGVAIFIRNRG